MNHPSNENIPSRSFSYHAFNFTFLLLLAVFFISLYTVALLKSNSRITLSAAVERNISCSDAVHFGDIEPADAQILNRSIQNPI